MPRWRQASPNSHCLFLAWEVGEWRHLLLPQTAHVSVTGGMQQVLLGNTVKSQCPIPIFCLDRPPLPHSLRSVMGSSVFETLQASINKCGISPAAAHSRGKATAAKALTWRFTQTLSGFAIRQQQNVRLLLLLLHFTSLL